MTLLSKTDAYRRLLNTAEKMRIEQDRMRQIAEANTPDTTVRVNVAGGGDGIAPPAQGAPNPRRLLGRE